MPQDNNAPRDHRDQPTYWFAILDIARERSDFARAAEAQRQLRRLGVEVSFAPLNLQSFPMASRGAIQ